MKCGLTCIRPPCQQTLDCHSEGIKAFRKTAGCAARLRLQQSVGVGAETSLGRSWEQYSNAVGEAIRSEAMKVVELQAENEALKTALRNFKSLAQANARKLRALALKSDTPGT